MDSAMEWMPVSVSRRVALGLWIAFSITFSGCAQMRSFTAKDWPSLGSKESAALRDEKTPGIASKGDLYAKSVGKGESLSNEEIAASQKRNRAALTEDDRNRSEIERVSADQASIDLPRRTRRGAPAVTLLAPEALPGLPEPDQLVAQIEDADREEPEAKRWAGSTNAEDEEVAENTAPAAENATPAEAPVVEDQVKSLSAPSVASLDEILDSSRKALNAVSTYQVKMNHQERVNGVLNPPEDATLSIRRQPFAVRIEWADGPNKGREVLFLSDAKGGLMHIHMANSLVPTLTMAPNSPLATRMSRHPITEAGLDVIVAKMEDALRAQGTGDGSYGKITYEGVEKPDGINRDTHKILRVTPTGERWVVNIDVETKLPCRVQATSANGDLLERYVFLEPKLDLPELTEVAAFNPDARWGAPKGLLSRLARGAANGQATQTR